MRRQPSADTPLRMAMAVAGLLVVALYILAARPS